MLISSNPAGVTTPPQLALLGTLLEELPDSRVSFVQIIAETLPSPTPDRLKSLDEWLEAFERRGLAADPICFTLWFGVRWMLEVRETTRILEGARTWEAVFTRRTQRFVRELPEYSEQLNVALECQLEAQQTIAVERVSSLATALAEELRNLPDLLLGVRNSNGRIRRQCPGNPERGVIGDTRRHLDNCGVKDRTEQDDLLRLAGLVVSK